MSLLAEQQPPEMLGFWQNCRASASPMGSWERLPAIAGFSTLFFYQQCQTPAAFLVAPPVSSLLTLAPAAIPTFRLPQAAVGRVAPAPASLACLLTVHGRLLLVPVR